MQTPRNSPNNLNKDVFVDRTLYFNSSCRYLIIFSLEIQSDVNVFQSDLKNIALNLTGDWGSEDIKNKCLL